MHKLSQLIGFATVVHLCTAMSTAAVPRKRETSLNASVVTYHRNPGGIEHIMLAEVEFRIPSDCFLDEPRIRLIIDRSAGRELQEAASGQGRNDPWNLRPGGLNHTTIVLPADTIRWRMILTGREASLRHRCAKSLSLHYGWWARNGSGELRPVWLRTVRLLPSTPGRKVQLESPWLPAKLARTLELVHNHPASGKAGIASRLTIEHHRPGLPDPGRST
jgi:hypothetical protein